MYVVDSSVLEMKAVVDGEIARDDAARISQMQLRFTNGEIE